MRCGEWRCLSPGSARTQYLGLRGRPRRWNCCSPGTCPRPSLNSGAPDTKAMSWESWTIGVCQDRSSRTMPTSAGIPVTTWRSSHSLYGIYSDFQLKFIKLSALHSDLNCYVRYLDAQDKYDKQFLREMAHFIANQPNICDQYFLKRWARKLLNEIAKFSLAFSRLYRILCYKTRWPPLHTKRELNNFVTKFFQLTPRQKRRVDYLMKTDLSLGC